MTLAAKERAGHFYVIQLQPQADPLLVKLGWATDVLRRLKSHRSVLSAPDAQIIQAWPCRREWEGAAMEAVSESNCAAGWAEVYRCANLGDLTARAEIFFSDPVASFARLRPTPKPNEPDIVEAGVIIRQFGIPNATLYRLVDEGRIPARDVTKPFHKRRHLLFNVREVGAAVERMRFERERRPTPPRRITEEPGGYST
jgi:hypothetical protein